MTTIRQDDVIQSVADALQYISYYHSPDFIQAMAAAYEREASPAAKDAIKQILVNSRMCAQGHRPGRRQRRAQKGGASPSNASSAQKSRSYGVNSCA